MRSSQIISEPPKIIVNKDTLRKIKNSLYDERVTIIHCTYVAKQKFINGGWVNIYPSTYLMNPVDRNQLKLQHAVNIPLAPSKHYFNKPGDVKKFILYFPPIPRHWKIFHLLEETNDNSGFTACNLEGNNSGIYEVFLE
ncbi:MAG: hypothetical protein WCK67_08625 [bacterium]